MSNCNLVMLAAVLLSCAVDGRAYGQTAVRTLIDQCRAAAEAGERVIAFNVSAKYRITIYEPDGRVAREYETVTLSNDRYVLSTRTKLTAPVNTWHLLRDEGVYTIAASQKAGEYTLSGFKPGRFRPSQTGCSIASIASPFCRWGDGLADHLEKYLVAVVSDRTDGGLRTVVTSERSLDDALAMTSEYVFRADTMMVQQFTMLRTDPPQKDYNRYAIRYTEIDGRTVLEAFESFRVPVSGPAWKTGLRQLIEYKRATPPDSTFSLSQFGLPEAVTTKPQPAATHYRWLVAAVALAAVAFLARRFANARAGRSAG